MTLGTSVPVGEVPTGTNDGTLEATKTISSYHGPRALSSGAVIVFSDGLCEPRNPGGWACWGWLALGEDGQTIASDCGAIGHGPAMTNNLAEYQAAIKALTWAADAGLVGVTLRTDSQLVVNQVTGVWQVKAANLWPLVAELSALVAATHARVEWVPRAENAKADALSRQAYIAAQGGSYASQH